MYCRQEECVLQTFINHSIHYSLKIWIEGENDCINAPHEGDCMDIVDKGGGGGYRWQTPPEPCSPARHEHGRVE